MSSSTATAHGDNTFSIDLVPELDIGHTAEPTVYLHNLSFTNTFANVSQRLYDNATIVFNITGVSDPVEVQLSDGAYSLQALELAIAEALEPHVTTIGGLMPSVNSGDAYYASGPAFIDGQYTESTGDVVYGKLTFNPIVRRLHLATASSVQRSRWEIALSIDEALAFSSAYPEPRDSNVHKAVIVPSESGTAYDFFVKPVTLEADNTSNRVRMMTCNSGLSIDFSKSTLFTKLLGFSDDQTLVTGSPPVASGTAVHPARVDRVRAVSFHCPSLASGTYSTSGKMGGSQLAMVPITAGIGEVQSWEASVPIKIEANVAGSVRHKLYFFLSNEDGLPISLLGDRFEAVMVLEY